MKSNSIHFARPSGKIRAEGHDMMSRLGRSDSGLGRWEPFSDLSRIQFPSFEEKGHIPGAVLRKAFPKRTRGTGSTSVGPATWMIPVVVRNAETLCASHERASPRFGSIAPSGL